MKCGAKLYPGTPVDGTWTEEDDYCVLIYDLREGKLTATCRIKETGEEMTKKGTYIVSGNEIIFSSEDGGETETVEFKLEGDTLLIYQAGRLNDTLTRYTPPEGR